MTVQPATRRAVLIDSPNAGNAVPTEYLMERLRRVGVVVAERLSVADLDRERPQGQRWRDADYDLVVVAGGDGTIGAVATQLAGSGLPLAILPLGTANDIARSLWLPIDLDQACAAIAGALPVEIDAGQVLPGLSGVREATGSAEQENTSTGVFFLHAATLGMNVEFARLATNVQRRQRLGGLTYAASALEAITRFRSLDLTLHLYGMEGGDPAAETVMHANAVQLSIVNMPVIGGRMGVWLPDVRLRDRQLDFMMIEAGDAGQLGYVVREFLAILGSAQDRAESVSASEEIQEEIHEAFHLPGVHRFRAQAATIETSGPLDVTLDGEILAHTPVLVRVAPQRIRVLVTPEAKRLLAHDREPDAGDGEIRRQGE